MKADELMQRAIGLFLEDLELGRYWANLSAAGKARKSRKAAAELEKSLDKQGKEKIAVEVDALVPAGEKKKRVKGRVAIDRKAFAETDAESFDTFVGGSPLRIELRAEDIARAGEVSRIPVKLNGSERKATPAEAAKLLRLERLLLLSQKMAEGYRQSAEQDKLAKLDYLKKSFETGLSEMIVSLFGTPESGFRRRSKGLEAALRKLPRLEREQMGPCQDWIEANGKGMIVRLKDLYGITMFAVQIDSIIYNPLTNEEIIGGIAEKQYLKLEGEKFARSEWIKLAVPEVPAAAPKEEKPTPSVLSDDAAALVEQRHRKEFDTIVALGDEAQARARELFFETLDIERYDENSVKIMKAVREAKDSLAAALGNAKAAAGGAGGLEGADVVYDELKRRTEAVFYAIRRDLERQAAAPIKLHMDAKRTDSHGAKHHEHADATFDHSIFAGTEAQRIAMMVDGEQREIEIDRRSLQQAITGPSAVVRINGEPMKIRSEDAVALLKLNKFMGMFNRKIEALEKLKEKKERINEAVKVREGIHKRLATLVESLKAEPAVIEQEKPAAPVDYESSLLCKLTKAKTLEEAVGMLVGAPVKFRDERGVERAGTVAGVLNGKVIIEMTRTQRLFSIFQKQASSHMNVPIEGIIDVTPTEVFFIRQLQLRVDEAHRRMKAEKLTPQHQLEVALSVIELAEQQPELLGRIIKCARDMKLSVAYTDEEKMKARNISLEHYKGLKESEKLTLLKLGLDHIS